VLQFPAGGLADTVIRVLANPLSQSLGQPVVIDNKPGADGAIAGETVKNAPPDGYTLFFATNSALSATPVLRKKPPYDPVADFTPITFVGRFPFFVFAHPSLQVKSVQELIAQAKAHPGKLNYASSGPGTPYHMAGELFKAMTGTDIVHVPYKGSDGARVGILGGQVHMMLDAITTMAPHVRAGKVKAMGTTGVARSSILPDVPTLAEAGVPGYETGIWLGLMAPAGTPRPVLERLNAEVMKVLNSAEVKEAWLKQGALTMGMSIDRFDKFLRDDIAKWSKVVKATGMKVE